MILVLTQKFLFYLLNNINKKKKKNKNNNVDRHFYEFSFNESFLFA